MWPYKKNTKFNNFTLWALVAVLSILPGCRRETPPDHKTQPTPAGQGDTDKKPAPTKPPGPVTSLPAGADPQDDPDAPRCLPKTKELRDWIKTEPVKVATSNKIKELIKDRIKPAALKTYKIRLAAGCTYAIEKLVADVLLVEAETPVDAYGLFSITTPHPGEFNNIDGSVRASEKSSDTQILTAWQGNNWIRAEFTGVQNKDSEQACYNLVNRIVFNIPLADPPLLLRCIPPKKSAGSKLWVFRDLAALAGIKNEILQKINVQKMNARLGLTGKEILSAASVKVADDEKNNLIWMVQYQNIDDATAAYKRYKSALESPGNPLDGNTIVYSPKGKFLIGSWTAGQESLQHLLDELNAVLPD